MQNNSSSFEFVKSVQNEFPQKTKSPLIIMILQKIYEINIMSKFITKSQKINLFHSKTSDN